MVKLKGGQSHAPKFFKDVETDFKHVLSNEDAIPKDRIAHESRICVPKNL